MRRFFMFVLLLIIWELGVRLTGVLPIILPPPTTVFMELWRLVATGTLFPYIWNTLSILLSSLVIGVAAAFMLTALAILTEWGKDLQRMCTAMFNPLPAIALLPLALLWFGLGTRSLMFVIVHSVVWTFSVNTFTGFVTVPETMVRVGRNLGLKGWKLVRSIYIPAALPYILVGLKLSWAYAWRTVIAAELVFGVTGSKGGIGWFIYKMRYSLDTPAVFAGLCVIIAIGLTIDVLFRRIEDKTVRRWGMST